MATLDRAKKKLDDDVAIAKALLLGAVFVPLHTRADGTAAPNTRYSCVVKPSTGQGWARTPEHNFTGGLAQCAHKFLEIKLQSEDTPMG